MQEKNSVVIEATVSEGTFPIQQIGIRRLIQYLRDYSKTQNNGYSNIRFEKKSQFDLLFFVFLSFYNTPLKLIMFDTFQGITCT